MTNYPESGVKLVADTKQYTSAMDYAIFQAEYFDSFGEISISVTADVDVGSVESDLSDIPDQEVTVTPEIDIGTVESDLSDIPDQEVTVTPEVDTETVETDLADIPDQEVQVDVQETDTTKQTLNALDTLKNLKIIETVWNVAGSAVGIFQNVGSKLLDPMLKLGDAVAEVGAKTGGAIPNADKLINGIFYDDLGKSKEEVGQLIITAHGLGLPVEEATRAALTFTHTWGDQSSTTALTTFGTMLKTNLVDNMQEASDLVTVFFQNGGNKAGDALQVVNANAQSWSDMGLSAQEALSTITTLLDGNVDSASDAAKMIQTLDDSLTKAAADANSPEAKMLQTMGIKNPKDSGKAMGGDFINGFAEAFTNLPPDKQDMASGMFMGKGGKKFTGAIKDMTSSSDIFANVKDQAALAATEIDNSLSGAIDDFTIAAQKAAEDFLSSDQLDLPGKIDALKSGLQDGLAVLQNDGSLSDALTVALKPIGFDDEFQGLESMLGNFVIALLQIVSSIQSMNPDSWDAKKGTDALIQKQGATQLAFDLKIANPDDVATDIATATSRGLSSAQIADTVSGTIDELIKTGTADSMKQAQDLIDTMKKPIDMNKVPLLANGTPMNVEPTVTPEAIAGLQAKLDAAQPVTVNLQADDKFASTMVDSIMPITTATDSLTASSTTATPSVQATADATKSQGDNAGTAAPKVQAVADNTKKVGDNAAKATPPIAGVNNELTRTHSVGDLAALSLAGVNRGLQDMINMANKLIEAAKDKTGADPAGAAGAGATPAHGLGTSDATGTFWAGDQGPELITTDKHLAVLNNATSQRIMQSLFGYIPGGNTSGQQGNRTNIVNNNNYVESEAQADAVGYSTAKELRGM